MNTNSNGTVDQIRLWLYNPLLFEGVRGYKNLLDARESLQSAGWLVIEKDEYVSCGTVDLSSCQPITKINGKAVILTARVTGSVTPTQGRVWVYDNHFVEGPNGTSNMTKAHQNIVDAGWVIVDQADCMVCSEPQRQSCRRQDCFEDKFVLFSVKTD